MWPLASLAASLRTDTSPPDKGGFFIGTPRSPSALALRSRPPHSPSALAPHKLDLGSLFLCWWRGRSRPKPRPVVLLSPLLVVRPSGSCFVLPRPLRPGAPATAYQRPWVYQRQASALALRSCHPHPPSALALRSCPSIRSLRSRFPLATLAVWLRTEKTENAAKKTTLRRYRLTPVSTFVSAGAPPPPHPRGLRLPLRCAVSVLAVTRCGMIAAPLSREVTLLRAAPSPVGLRGLWSGRSLFRHRAVAATPSRLLQFRFRSFFRLLPGVAAGR